MLRRITLILALLALVGFGLAQTVRPTGSELADPAYGDDEVSPIVFGTTAGEPLTASVSQDVNLKIPPVVALHLDVTDLEFDISEVGDYDDGTWVCVYGADFTSDDPLPTDAFFTGQPQVLPLGTSYLAGTWPNITIQNHGGVVDQYPPFIIDDATGELVEGSKNYFVCYRTFILQKFSTIPGWELSVERSGGTYDMYIQDNTCADFGDPTGLYKIDADPIRLLPTTMTGATTGALAAGSICDGKSWLDDLVVVAVKVNGEAAGDNVSTLTYSLTATVPKDY